MPLSLKSLVFANNARIPGKYTCDGEDINPPLEIGGVPETTKSLVLLVDDPDAPAGTWVHWAVWNIAPTTQKIGEKSVPAGATEGVTSFGKPGYGGPCPPSGSHRYFFKLFALDSELNLPTSADAKALQKAMEGHILDKTELLGLYSRS